MRLFTILAWFALSVALFAADDDPVHWFSSYQEAIQEAKRTQKPIFLEYRCEP